jgi:hypothetical protein
MIDPVLSRPSRNETGSVILYHVREKMLFSFLPFTTNNTEIQCIATPVAMHLHMTAQYAFGYHAYF